MVPELVPAPVLTSETDPVTQLDVLASRSPAQARKGLAMAINDMVEATADWTAEEIERIDGMLASEGLASFTEIRLRFSAVVRRAVARRRILNEVEYYAIRNASELTAGEDQSLRKLFADYDVGA